jgi:hypothetical protein
LKKLLLNYMGENIKLEISGGKILTGILVEVGSDIVIIYNGKDFQYVPIVHVHHIRFPSESEQEIQQPVDPPIIDYEQELSVRKILTSAKGMFTEIYVTSNQPIHGYITSIMNNYFVFHSPVHKTMFISLNHLKWLIPYDNDQSPYSLPRQDLPLRPVNISLARSFEIQMEKQVGKLVIFNIGENPNTIGKLQGIRDNILELVTARGECLYLNVNHIKTMHFT